MDARLILDTRTGRKASAEEVPPALVVDLDSALLKSDLLSESILALLKQNILYLLLLTFWLLKGKAHLKHEVARRVSLDVTTLPYCADLLDYLQKQRLAGRPIVLATASDMRIAQQVADHLKLFELVLASDGVTNLSGKAKQERLASIFLEKGFDYVADARRDLAVWPWARKAIVVDSSPRFRSRVQAVTEVDRVFATEKRSFANFLAPLRIRHWFKNLLLFVPFAAAHRLFEVDLWQKTILAFLAFGLCASGGYVLNDLFDLSADRRHPEKRLRSFASGKLPLTYGFAMIPGLVALGCLIGLLVSPLFLLTLSVYLALTIAYSLYVRKVVLLDVIFLAGLYTMRIMAGSAAISIWPSHWLLAFSTFLFLSLALVKRYGELVIMKRVNRDQAKARGYELDDEELLAAMGTASGFIAVMVLALYINSDIAQTLYDRYQLMWFLCPLLLYWISHIWLVAHRGKMPGDPVVFATSDRVSRILTTLMLVIILLAL